MPTVLCCPLLLTDLLLDLPSLILPVSWEISRAGPLCGFCTKADKGILWQAPTHTNITNGQHSVTNHLTCSVGIGISCLQGQVRRVVREHEGWYKETTQTLRYFLRVYSWLATVSCSIRGKGRLIFSFKRSRFPLGFNLGPTFLSAGRFNSAFQKRVVPSLRPVVQMVGRNISISGGSTPAKKVSNPQFFSRDIFNYNVCFGLADQRLSAFYLFTYLFIYLFNFNFLWAVQLRYINKVGDRSQWRPEGSLFNSYYIDA